MMTLPEIFPPMQVILRPHGCTPVRTSPVRNSPQFQIVLDAKNGSAGHCFASTDQARPANIPTMINPIARIEELQRSGSEIARLV
ncbi:hypothetical protein X265_12230 [Bradyrhizobium guangdongense]|nr:hypothetical protein X265_12230 [Bradyrhizobium guangdongense]